MTSLKILTTSAILQAEYGEKQWRLSHICVMSIWDQ